MYRSKFIRLYQRLDKPALRRLRQWLQSPLHLRHGDVRLFFSYLESRRVLSPVSLRRDRVFAYLYPGQPYDDARLRQVVHSALGTLQQFVGYYHAVLDEFQVGADIARGLMHWGADALAGRMCDSLRRLPSRPHLRSETLLRQQYEVEQLTFDLAGTQTRAAANNLPTLFASLSASFALSTLRYACVAASHTHVSAARYEIPLLPEVLAAADLWQHIPAITLYRQAYLALSQSDAQHFAALKDAFFTYRHHLAPDEQQELLLMAINTCIRLLNTGDETFAHEAFALYQGGLATGVLLDGEQISRFTYKNIVSIGLKLHEYTWTRAFIETYTPRLEARYRDSYHAYNLARLCFAEGAHHEAHQLLTRIGEYDDTFFDLGARMMLLKIYYESGEHDALDALLTSFARHLQRKTVLGYHKKVYQNIIRLARKMLALPPGHTPARAALREEIRQTQPLAERSWLLAQLDRGD